MKFKDTLLEARQLTKIYSAAQPVIALDHIDLTFKQGEFISIVGQSGSGKSTLMNLLGLLDSPTKGELYYLGQNTAKWDDREKSRFRNRDIGFIFQSHLLLPEFTALENVLIPVRIGGRHGPETLADAEKMLDRIGMGQRMTHLPAELSGGQSQRVAIARALVNHPRIVFADEPTGNLDSQTSLAVYELMREINREEGVTFVIVTHEHTLAEKADRVVTLLDGRIISDEKNKPPLVLE